MKDETLERIWKSRKAIAAKCDYDSRKLVKYYQQRMKKLNRTIESSGQRSAASDS